MRKIDSARWWIFIGGALMVFLINVDATIVNLALATIAREFRSSLLQVQWVINAYVLTSVIFFIIGGKLADLYGAKIIFLTGTVIFGMASFIAGISPNFSTLIVARLIQGIGFAFTLALAILVITRAFPEKQRGFILGMIITITGLGLAMGPTIGGVILEFLNWHWIFLINVPFCVVSFIIIFVTIKEIAKQKQKKSVDFLGAFLLGFSITALLLALAFISHQDYCIEWPIIWLLISGLGFLGLFWRESTARFPLMNLMLFKRRDYILSVCIRCLFMYAYATFLLLIPLYLQNILNYTPMVSGLVLLVFSSVFGIVAPSAGMWCDRAGYKIPIFLSSVLCLSAYLMLTMLSYHATIYILLFGLLLLGLSTAGIFPSTINSTILSLPRANSGEGLGVFFTVAFIGVSLGVSISGAQMETLSARRLVVRHSLTISERKLLRGVANGTQSSAKLKTYLGPTSTAVVNIAKQSFISSLRDVMWINVILSFLMLMLTLLFKKGVSRVNPRKNASF